MAAALFASVMGGLAPLFAVAARANQAAAGATWATFLAAQKIEELRSAPLPESDGEIGVELFDHRGRPIEAAGALPAYTRRARTDAFGGPAGTVVITVVVSRRGGPEVRLVTLRTPNEP